MERLKDRSSVKKIIGQMTLEEKAGALTGGSLFSAPGWKSMGYRPCISWTEARAQIISRCIWIAFAKTIKCRRKAAAHFFDMNSEAQAVPELLALDADEQAAAQADEKTRKEVAMMKEKMKAYIPGGVMPGCFLRGFYSGRPGTGKTSAGWAERWEKKRIIMASTYCWERRTSISTGIPSAEDYLKDTPRTPAWWQLAPGACKRRPGGGSTCQSQAFCRQ